MLNLIIAFWAIFGSPFGISTVYTFGWSLVAQDLSTLLLHLYLWI